MSEKFARYDKVAQLSDDAEWTARLRSNDDTVLVVMDDEGNVHRMGENIDVYEIDDEDNNPCLDGYVQDGTVMKDGEEVPNCVPVEEAGNDE